MSTFEVHPANPRGHVVFATPPRPSLSSQSAFLDFACGVASEFIQGALFSESLYFPRQPIVKEHGLEGIVSKRMDSVYEHGKRSGLWSKYRINLGQEFVIGGYTLGDPFDALIIGFYRGKDLMFAGRVRAGFVPATRREVFAKIKKLKIPKFPFANLPEKEPGPWGQGLTAEKMKSCIWVKPEVVVRIDFAEWTGADKLRYTKFVAMRGDKAPRRVLRET